MDPKHPPGPTTWTLGIRQAQQIRHRPLEFLIRLREEYGDFVKVRMGAFRFYWAFHSDLVREILITKARQFRRAGRQVKVLRQWDGNGLVLSDGDFWLRQRRLVQPAFHARRLAGYARAMVGCTQTLVDRWLADGREVEIVQA